jgi:alpha-tubulin suppressor-like RCC1 family protein
MESCILSTVACGENHTLILTDSKEIYAMGSPLYGKLGLGLINTVQTTPKKIPGLSNVHCICCGPDHSMALVAKSDSEEERNLVYSWGGGWDGKLGHGLYFFFFF